MWISRQRTSPGDGDGTAQRLAGWRYVGEHLGERRLVAQVRLRPLGGGGNQRRQFMLSGTVAAAIADDPLAQWGDGAHLFHNEPQVF